MKKIILISIIVAFTYSCKAQISPLFGSENGIYTPNSGHYYKDVDNNFNTFIGEWKWQNGNSSFTIVLNKIENVDEGDGYTFDALFGEYQYIENGVEKANTLPQMDDPNLSPFEHTISNALIMSNLYLPQCNDCNEGERRIGIILEHPDYDDIKGELIMRYKIENGIEKLYTKLLDDRPNILPQGAPEYLDMPFGEYIFIKQ